MTISESTNVLSRDFRNLKTHVKRHFENEVCLKNGYDWQEKENHKSKCEIREHGAGKRIATLCRLPNWVIQRNFEQEILKSVLNRLDIGDINHSPKLYPNFIPFVSEQVTEQLHSFFGSRLDHTGCKPPVNLQADKETNFHKTRQFTSAVTAIPESTELLTYINVGQPVVKSHDGPGVTRSIIDELHSQDIQGGQVEGRSFDGQYFHFRVPAHLTGALHFLKQFICTWDPFHK